MYSKKLLTRKINRVTIYLSNMKGETYERK